MQMLWLTPLDSDRCSLPNTALGPRGPLPPSAPSVPQLKITGQCVEQNRMHAWSSSGLVHKTLMGINAESLKCSILNCASWAGAAIGPNTREAALGKAAGQLVEEITFLTTKAQSETAYLSELSTTCSKILPA